MTIAHRKAMDHHRSRARQAIPVADPPEVAHHNPPPHDDETRQRVRALPCCCATPAISPTPRSPPRWAAHRKRRGARPTSPARLDQVRRELDEYFAGKRTTFDLPIDWAHYSDFGRRVLQATAAIPFGQTATYGDMAREAGNAKASRAAGRALGANANPIIVPCHPVIGSSGKLTGYTGGMHRKEALLRLEGIAV
jgi:O-6-methylguanine DNA methyltransferase